MACSTCGMPGKKIMGILLIVTAVTFFIAGARFQHQEAVVYLNEVVQKDPYAFHVREKIYEAFSLFPVDVDRLPLAEDDVTRTPMASIMKYGFPGMDCLIAFSDFMLSYDRRNRVAHWVYERVTPATVRKSHGHHDHMRIPTVLHSEMAVHRHTVSERKHLLTTAGHRRRHRSHCNDTFFLINIAPQLSKGFNREAWHKLEIYVRNLAEMHESVYVCSGPLYKPTPNDALENNRLMVEYELLGEHIVAVPTHFFKVIIVESKLAKTPLFMESYLMPNKPLSGDIDISTFLCDIREIEQAAGLKFYNGIRQSIF